jgi:arabinogalactan endo-1,4-beta-galactosidase
MNLIKFSTLTLMLAIGSAWAEDLPFLGVDANYSLGMEREGKQWRWNGKPHDLFQGMAESGVRGLRVRLWTKDEGTNGKRYATEVVKRALAAGLDPYLVIFLSDDWADLMKQPAPAAWKDQPLEQRAETVKHYSRDIVAHFRQQGLRSHLYEIGNEIDYGICGVYPGKSTKKSPESLSRRCWPQAAQLIRASQAGVLEADPEAKFMLHIAHWWDVKFVTAFFQFMLRHDVRVDYAGLSYFPSSNIGGSLQIEQFGQVATALHEAIQRPIIVPETAYPSTADFKGQFARWKKEVPGYPLTPDGQRRWLRDFIDHCTHHPAISAVYYWSPEWCGEGMWKAMALFDPDGQARPAWSAFAKPRDQRAKPKTLVYLEVVDSELLTVPVDEARKRTAAILAEKLKQHGGLNVDYIKDITATEVVVSGYQVALRASLSGNLDLIAKPGGATAQDSQSLLEQLNPTKQRAVIFMRDPTDGLLPALFDTAKKMGLEAGLHPIPQDRALRFGLSGF